MKKIFVVDDETDLCFFIKQNLEATGAFEVSTCSDSSEAVEQIKESRPDVVLLDVLMPGFSGPEIAEQLQKDPATQNIPIVFLTAIVTEEEASTKKNLIGGRHVLAKPVQVQNLLGVLETVAKEG